MIPVVFKSYKDEFPATGYWDQDFVKMALRDILWQPVSGYDFHQVEDLEHVDDGCVLVIPAGSHAYKIDEINESIARLRWVVLILSSDEQSVFPVEQIEHPNKIIYLMTPDFDKDLGNVDRYIGEGFPLQTDNASASLESEDASFDPSIDVFFSGQRTHRRRQECLDAIEPMEIKKRLIATEGFAQGLDAEDYYNGIIDSRIVPCPSGPCTVDSFRFFETLELGRIPLADTLTPEGKGDRYWQRLFGQEELPFEVIRDWEHVGGNIMKVLANWRHYSNVCFAWWQNYKRQFVYNLHEDVKLVSGVPAESNYLLDNLTVLVCTSPIRSHPSLAIIRETLDSIRDRLPESEIIVMVDGIRPEQEYLRDQYERYTANLLWMINTEYENVLPMVFEEHMHQTGMTREALTKVKTPAILFVEHDTPLCGDIEFTGITEAVLSGAANVVRLHHETHILVEHEHMMLDTGPSDICGVPLMKTVQWSQRPHVSTKEFYERILYDHFSENARSMIEDVMHGVVHAPYCDRGRAAWSDFKLWMYTPSVDDMKRSTNLDGRGDEEKYGMVF